MSRVLAARFMLCGGLLLLFLSSLVGCGRTTGTVSGKVTHQGQPLTSGAVIFHGADGRSDSGHIDVDGNYTVSQAPVGPVKVTVDTGSARRVSPPKITGPRRDNPAKHPGEKSGTNPAPMRKVVIPEKYKDPNQSGLTFTVSGRRQTFDIKVD
jgi:hypothetical protein